MARTPKNKEVIRSRLLKNYASWIYCENCNKTIAYLCYITYDFFNFNYQCNCGNTGQVKIEFETEIFEKSEQQLVEIKNRLCCPNDAAPLITILENQLLNYDFEILCNQCHIEYKQVKGRK